MLIFLTHNTDCDAKQHCTRPCYIGYMNDLNGNFLLLIVILKLTMTFNNYLNVVDLHYILRLHHIFSYVHFFPLIDLKTHFKHSQAQEHATHQSEITFWVTL